MSAKASCFWWIFLWSPIFLFFEFRWCRWCHHLFFFIDGLHGFKPLLWKIHRRSSTSAGRIRLTFSVTWSGFSTDFHMVFSKILRPTTKKPDVWKHYLKTLSEIMGSLSTNKPTDAYSSLASSLVNAGCLVAINRMVCVLFFWLQKFCFLGLGWTSGNDSVPTHPTCRSQWEVPKKAVVVFLLIFYGGKCAVVFFLPLEKKPGVLVGFFFLFFFRLFGVFFSHLLFLHDFSNDWGARVGSPKPPLRLL